LRARGSTLSYDVINGEVENQFEYSAKDHEEDVQAALKEEMGHLPVSNAIRLTYVGKLTDFTSPHAIVH